MNTHQAVVQRGRKLLEIEPNVEGALWRDLDFEMKLLETREDVVALRFEMLLESNLCSEMRIVRNCHR